MADTPASPSPAAPLETASAPAASAPAASAPAASAAPAFKKGALVRVGRAAYGNSLEAGASDPEPPAYIFEGPGEILAIKGAHAQLRWRRPVPDVWLRLDQLEPYPAG
ncbi:MAG: NAD(P)H-quinone oxidoreductase subunit O [Cyanobium sp.]